MVDSQCKLLDYDVLLVDMDGVLWRGSEPIAENVSALKRALEQGVTVVLVTNNSTRSRRLYSFLVEKMGLPIPSDRIITSAYSAARLVSRLHSGGAHVLVIGEHGLTEEFVLEGHLVLTHSEWREADYVVAGLDRKLDYQTLSSGVMALRGGAVFVATNLDPTLPMENGVGVGSGGVISLLEKASGHHVDYVAGKPSCVMGDTLEKFVSKGKTLFIGDRVDTDMEQARMLGIDGLLLSESPIPTSEEWFCTSKNLSLLV